MKRRSLLLGVATSSIGTLLYGCTDKVTDARQDGTQPDSGAPQRRGTEVAVNLPRVPDSPPSASSASSPATTPAVQTVEPLAVEKVLYNLGLQSNLAGLIRQGINLFSLLSPALQVFAAGEKLDRAYLVPGINNKRLFESLFSQILPHATTSLFSDANDVVKVPGVRSFLVDYWSSLYEHKAFVEFSSKPFEGSDWRRSAILQLNTLWYLDSLHAAILRPIAPVIMGRMRIPADASAKALIESTSASLAFFRTAWATSNFSDDDLYQLTKISSSAALNKVLGLVAGTTAVVCSNLAKSMDSGLPPDLSGVLKKPLDSLKNEAT